MRIRDPIHGTIAVSDEEKTVIDNRFFQRLRQVKQLGFGDYAYPGATHTRHAHSLGAMHVASKLFDSAMSRAEMDEADKKRLRAALRVAVLCHDIGHMPLSHTSERVAPLRETLGLPAWLGTFPVDDQATHEDYTVKLILDSPLRQDLEPAFAPLGISPESIAALISGAPSPEPDAFRVGGMDWTPLLRSLVSGELDADRMDYLLRDSFFTGAMYGRFDLDWVTQNLDWTDIDGRANLALSRSAVFAFEDFLLSRYHMFLAVYYHHTTVAYDSMLMRYFVDAPGEFDIPSDPEAFLLCDDVALWYTLKRSSNPWAQRIANRSGFKTLAQFTERDAGYDLDSLEQTLRNAGLETFSVESQGVLSKYFVQGEADGVETRGPSSGPSLYIVDRSTGRRTEVARYTPLYQRYAGAVRLSRIYIRRDQFEAGQRVLAKEMGAPPSEVPKP